MLNLTIKLRLIGTMIGGGLMGIYGVQASNQVTKDIFDNQLPSVQHLSHSRIELLRARILLMNVIAHPDAGDITEQMRKAEQELKLSDTSWKKYLDLPAEGGEKKVAAEANALREKFEKEAFTPVLAAIRSGKREVADQISQTSLVSISAAYSEKVEQLENIQLTTSEAHLKKSQNAFSTFIWLDVIGVSFGLLLVLLSGYLLMRSITKPLNVVLNQFESIGEGDLTKQIRAESQDEMGQLLVSLEKMRLSLVRTVAVVRQSSESIGSSSDEIATGNMDLSSRTEQQAASLEETASSMEELTSTVQQNADNARQANALAMSASEVAVRGGDVVGNVVHTMSSIKDSSSKIVDIIGVIDGIAFQTNILALNAAVEAARAGEQGRGFAVVATEVRSLAQRSANAAKEIKELISDSVAKVEAGTRLVDDAGKTMDEIVVSIKSVTDIMSEITAASVEQSDGISQVNLAITKMDETTQQNAALVEQAAAAASSMQEQARNLNNEVSIFKLNPAEVSNTLGTQPKTPDFSAPPQRAPAQKKAHPKPAVRAIASPKAKAPSQSTSAAPSSKDEDWNEF
jgi:methyl-accepting chemotaxis protein I, serine sensor receptor